MIKLAQRTTLEKNFSVRWSLVSNPTVLILPPHRSYMHISKKHHHMTIIQQYHQYHIPSTWHQSGTWSPPWKIPPFWSRCFQGTSGTKFPWTSLAPWTRHPSFPPLRCQQKWELLRYLTCCGKFQGSDDNGSNLMELYHIMFGIFMIFGRFLCLNISRYTINTMECLWYIPNLAYKSHWSSKTPCDPTQSLS